MPADLRRGPAPAATSPADPGLRTGPGAPAAPTAAGSSPVSPAPVAPRPAARPAPGPEGPGDPTGLRRAVVALAVAPTLVVLLLVGDAGGALDASAWTPGLLPSVLLLAPGGTALVSFLALAALATAAAEGAVALRRRLAPSTGAGSHRAAAVVLLLVAPLLGEAVADPVLAAAVGAVVLAGGCCARAVRDGSRAARGTATAAVLLAALVLPVQAWWTALVSTSPSPSVLPWLLLVGGALLVPAVHGRARVLLAATSVSAGVALLVGAAGL